MAKIVNGNIMGVQMYGEVTPTDIQNFAEFAQALVNLEKSLTKLFDERMAKMVMKNILGDTQINLSEGEVENAEMWEMLCQIGVVGKSESQKKSNSSRLTLIEMI